MKKILSLTLALLLIVGTMGAMAESVFPLAEPASYTFMYTGATYDLGVPEELALNKFLPRLEEETNVHIDWYNLGAEPLTVLNALYASGNQGDAIIGGVGTLSLANVAIFASQELLVDVSAYLTDPEIMPNFTSRVLAENPLVMGAITSPDGGVYTLPKYTALEGNYLESVTWINKTWLDTLNLAAPETMADLEAVMEAFATGDPNGNGVNDEIPYLWYNSNAMNHSEALLYSWGIGTKSGNNDNYLAVRDGQVYFAPVTEAYKEALTKMAEWYAKGYFWTDCFTGTSETYNAKISGAVSVVGIMNGKNPPVYENDDEYIRILPFKVEGYEPSVFIHPGLNGAAGMMEVTDKCEDVETLMRYMDKWYAFESYVEIYNGAEGDGGYEIVDGKVVPVTLTNEQKEEIYKTSVPLSQFLGNMPVAITADDYASRYALVGNQAIMQENYAMYSEAGALAVEGWPRPQTSADDTERLAEIRTDIFNTVELKKAEWICGVSDIDAEWDGFVASLNNMGLEEFVKIYQRTYDNFMSNVNR